MTEYFKPSVTVDALVIWPQQRGKLLLIQRANPPFAGSWALPGGFIEEHEDLLSSVQRELEEETSLKIEEMTFFGAYGTPGRDPRGRTITLAYYALLSSDRPPQIRAQDDARAVRWFELQDLPELAFDHAQIIQEGLHAICCRLMNRSHLPELELSASPELLKSLQSSTSLKTGRF